MLVRGEGTLIESDSATSEAVYAESTPFPIRVFPVFRGGELNAINDSWEHLPFDLRTAAKAELAAGESPLAWLELDLDTRLHFSRGLVVLTPRRLLAVEPEESTEPEPDKEKETSETSQGGKSERPDLF